MILSRFDETKGVKVWEDTINEEMNTLRKYETWELMSRLLVFVKNLALF